MFYETNFVFPFFFSYIGWLVERDMATDFETLDEVALSNTLRQFYGEVNPTKEGDTYKRSSLRGIRAGINRHLTSPPFNRILNIVTDKTFIQANKILNGRIRINRENGQDVTVHKSAIAEGDIEKMYSSLALSNDNPQSLQHKVFFEISLHFGRRGREGLYQLQKESFCFKTDDRGCEYVTIVHNECSKKNKGLDAKLKEKEQLLYAAPNDPNCPVESLRLYLSKLNPQDPSFFQRPRTGKNVLNEPIWYCNKRVGENKIAGFMKEISKQAKLSKTYTNHCIRATTSTVLSHQNFNQNDIIAVTGHKDPKSLMPYVASTSSNIRREMSSVLMHYGKASDKPEASHIVPSICMDTDNLRPVSNVSTVVNNQEVFKDLTNIGMKVFEGNTFQGGNFNINFNLK